MEQNIASAGWRKRRPEEGEPEWETMHLAAVDALLLPDPRRYWDDPSAAAAAGFLPQSKARNHRSPPTNIAFTVLFIYILIFFSSLQMEDIFYPAHEPDILQLLHGPRDERDLSKCLAGEACSLTMRDHVTVQASPDPILNLLDFIPKDGRRCGMRRARKRKIFPLKSLCSKPARGKRHCQRKNNAHWTLNEVAKLVKGISKYGVSRWTKLKRDYFPESLRTAVHLKDKWRNLLKACGINITSRKKGKTQKTMLRPLDTRLIEQIKQVASKHPYPRPKYS
ncbi:uncharacterized protein LOC102701027 [Oryza brachyantha]|uniref:uncharacterized protein LOC102701027 n=1 Tax=Oryza brachyantha TaxID=4533 RepID=UPI001ADCA339|nr:uncharacterized protein LOC102701027 [Oryza brachyantha]